MLYVSAIKNTISFMVLKQKVFFLTAILLALIVSISLYYSFILQSGDSQSLFVSITKNKQLYLIGYLPASLLSLLVLNSTKSIVIIRYGDRYWNTVIDTIKIILVQSLLTFTYSISILISYSFLKSKIVQIDLPSNFYITLLYSILSLWLASIIINFFVCIIQIIFNNKGATLLLTFLIILFDSSVYNQFHISLLWSHGLVIQEKDLYIGYSSFNTILFLIGLVLILITIHFFVSNKIDFIDEGNINEDN